MTDATNREPRPSSIEEPSGENRIYLRVLGKFDLAVRSRSVAVGMSCQRLLTLLAIRGGEVNRVHAAGLLWPDVPAARANANLRSVLWRLQRYCDEVVEPTFYDLRLTPSVVVDIHEVQTIARRLLDRSAPIGVNGLRQALNCNLYDDIVPELTDEEWLTAESERHRQLRLHSLEALAEQLIAVEWYGAAVEAAFGAVQADPFRESARQLLIKAYLAEGNRPEAQRQQEVYCSLLRRELDLEPSDRFMRILGDWRGQSAVDQSRSRQARDSVAVPSSGREPDGGHTARRPPAPGRAIGQRWPGRAMNR